MRVNRVEFVLSIIVALVLLALLAAYAGGPIFSDELLYIDAGLKNSPLANLGNRFFHIYLQKLFTNLAPEPLLGVKIFWAFVITSTAWLVYWDARLFTDTSHQMHGFIALAIFFGYRMIAQYSGGSNVDITAMFMVTVLVSIYLLYFRVEKNHSRVLFALGAVVFLAFKTKETTLFANVILLGLLFDQQGLFTLKRIKDIYKTLLLGFLGGIAVFIVLDGIFLRRPFFSISPATFQAVFNNYAYTGGFRQEPMSWYAIYLLDDLAVPFLLFLFSGAVLSKELAPQKKMLWVFPFVLVSFITLNMLKIPWGFIERFFFPALPVLALLAPQFLRFELPRTRKRWAIFAAIAAAVLLAYYLLRIAIMRYVVSIDWDYAKFVETIFFPIVLSALLAAVLWVQRWKLANIALPLFCLFWLLLSPLTYTYKYIYNISFTGQIFEQIYYPFSSLQAYIPQRSDVVMYVSAAMQTELGMLSDDLYEVVAMYDLYFDQRISRDQIRMAYDQEDIPAGLTAQQFDFAFLTSQEWDYLQTQSLAFQQVQERFAIHLDPLGQFVLLVEK